MSKETKYGLAALSGLLTAFLFACGAACLCVGFYDAARWCGAGVCLGAFATIVAVIAAMMEAKK